MTLRPALASDVPALARLSGQLGYASDEAAMGRRLRALAMVPESEVLVAEDEEAVVGWIHVLAHRGLETDPVAEIGGLVVDENARGRGIGKALVAAAEAWARTRGLERMRVRSNTLRADAHRFYLREGYSVLKTQVNFQKALK